MQACAPLASRTPQQALQLLYIHATHALYFFFTQLQRILQENLCLLATIFTTCWRKCCSCRALNKRETRIQAYQTPWQWWSSSDVCTQCYNYKFRLGGWVCGIPQQMSSVQHQQSCSVVGSWPLYQGGMFLSALEELKQKWYQLGLVGTTDESINHKQTSSNSQLQLS